MYRESATTGERVSDFHFVVVVKQLFEALVPVLPLLLLLGALFELELQESVGHNADPNVNGLYVVLDLGNRLLDLLEGTGIREGLASVVDLLLNLR